MARLIAHIDMNCCYVSCERLFNPSLEGRAVIVLSNNDGCAVSRSDEAKKLGIQLGDPWFKLAPRAKEWGLVALSSNYELYGSISERFDLLLAQHSSGVDKYSIDESFVTLGPRIAAGDVVGWARNLKADIQRQIGIPVCIGVANSRTLSKLANKTAKKIKSFGGVCVWDETPTAWREQLLERLPVNEVWGIADRLTKRLNGMGIHSIADLQRTNPVAIRDRFNVVLMRTVLELQGTPCIEAEPVRQGKEQLIFSRSFSEPITSREKMRQVLSVYAQQSAARLERHQQKAKLLQAFAGTSFYDAHAQSFPSVQMRLPAPTSDPKVLAQAAQQLLPRLVEDVKYVRAGVMLFDLSPATGQQAFEQFRFEHEERQIATLVDQVQRRVGRDMLGLGHGGLRPGPAWQMRRNMLSPRATTHWNELAIVKAN